MFWKTFKFFDQLDFVWTFAFTLHMCDRNSMWQLIYILYASINIYTNLNVSMDIAHVSMDDSKFTMDGWFLVMGLVSLCKIVRDFVFFVKNHGFFFVVISRFLILCWVGGLLFFVLSFHPRSKLDITQHQQSIWEMSKAYNYMICILKPPLQQPNPLA